MLLPINNFENSLSKENNEGVKQMHYIKATVNWLLMQYIFCKIKH